jgi:hypothetical protein
MCLMHIGASNNYQFESELILLQTWIGSYRILIWLAVNNRTKAYV